MFSSHEYQCNKYLRIHNSKVQPNLGIMRRIKTNTFVYVFIIDGTERWKLFFYLKSLNWENIRVRFIRVSKNFHMEDTIMIELTKYVWLSNVLWK